MHNVKLLFVIVALVSNNAFSQPEYTRYDTAVIPVTKDAQTSLHKVGLTFWAWGVESNYLINLDAPFTWLDCDVHQPGLLCPEEECYHPISCNYSSCIDARSYIDPICPSLNFTSKYGCGICAVTPINPISKTCKISQLTTRLSTLSGTDGRNPSQSAMYNLNFLFSCAPSSLKRSLPKGVTGVAAFSWSSLAFSIQLSNIRDIEKFALCLPSSSLATGVTFIGDGPYYLLPFPNLDIRSILSYTPMIRKNSKSLGYYIKIKRISIEGTPVSLPLLKTSYVKLSTIVPYTTLRSDIYKALITSFSKATKNIPKVNAVTPFSLCLKAGAIGSVVTGFRVPNIDLETEGGQIWNMKKK